jgi:hypothetical protein
MPTPTLTRYTEYHTHANAECPCIDAGTAATCPGTCHRENDRQAAALIDDSDRPDVATWLIVLGALFFVNIIAPALSALAGLVVR